ncbi:MAG: hypothetical protein ACK5RE_15905, partial [Pseudanabaena sp.]
TVTSHFYKLIVYVAANVVSKQTQEAIGGGSRRHSLLGFVFVLYQFTKVWQHFWELKTKPSKGFQRTKWRSHFVRWYNKIGDNYMYEFIKVG